MVMSSSYSPVHVLLRLCVSNIYFTFLIFRYVASFSSLFLPPSLPLCLPSPPLLCSLLFLVVCLFDDMIVSVLLFYFCFAMPF